jgi:hypothetical protein
MAKERKLLKELGNGGLKSESSPNLWKISRIKEKTAKTSTKNLERFKSW